MIYKKIFLGICLFFIVRVPVYAQQPGDSFNVKSFGAQGDGHTLDTKSFADAIAACVKAGGAQYTFPLVNL